MRWTINDQFSIKYIFGYTDYFYDRTSDVDLTSNTNTFQPGQFGQYSGDHQFYVSQETEYVSHELQFFNDWNDRLDDDDRPVLLPGGDHAAWRLLRLERERPVHTAVRLQCGERRGAEFHSRLSEGRPVHCEAARSDQSTAGLSGCDEPIVRTSVGNDPGGHDDACPTR